MIGTSRETVSRLFAGFKKQRLIEQSGSTLLIPNRIAFGVADHGIGRGKA